jgi:hypothetical protein
MRDVLEIASELMFRGVMWRSSMEVCEKLAVAVVKVNAERRRNGRQERPKPNISYTF